MCFSFVLVFQSQIVFLFSKMYMSFHYSLPLAQHLQCVQTQAKRRAKLEAFSLGESSADAANQALAISRVKQSTLSGLQSESTRARPLLTLSLESTCGDAVFKEISVILGSVSGRQVTTYTRVQSERRQLVQLLAKRIYISKKKRSCM